MNTYTIWYIEEDAYALLCSGTDRPENMATAIPVTFEAVDGQAARKKLKEFVKAQPREVFDLIRGDAF